MKESQKILQDSLLGKEENYLKTELYSLLKEDNLLFDFLQEAALDGLWFWDLNQPENEWMSAKFWTTLGYDPDDMPHKASAWQDIIYSEDLKHVYANFAKHSKDPSYPFDQIVRYRHKLGHTVWIRCRGVIIRDDQGKPMKMLGAHTDITGIKKKEQEQRLQSTFFKQVIDSTDLGTWQWNVKTGETILNERWAEMIGYSLSELEPISIDSWLEHLSREDQDKSNRLIKDHFTGKTPIYECEFRMKHKNGEWIWVLDKGKVVSWDEEGNPEWMIGSHQDITQRKKKEEEFRLQSAFFKHVIDGTGLGTWQWNVKTGETIFNERWANITGYTLSELAPVSIDTWIKYSHPDDLEKSNLLLQDHFAGKTPIYECEARMRHKNEEWIWVLDRGKVISWDEEGNPEWMIGSHQEITKTKKAFEKNRLFIEQAPSAIAMFDTNMHYLAASQKWYEDYNIKDDNIIGKSHYEVFPEIGERWKADHQECLSGAVLKSEEDRFERLDGSVQWLTWELRPWYTDEKKVGGILMHTSDITMLKEAEIRLRISEEMFRRNFENAAIGMAMLDQEGYFTKVNYKLCDILGYSNVELTKLGLKDVIHPHDIKSSNKVLQKLFNGKTLYGNIEKRCFHKNGQVVHVNISISVVKDENNAPSYFVTQIADISHKIVARQKVEEKLSSLKNIIDDITQVIIVGTDKDGLITTFNKGAENLLGYTKEEVLYKETAIIFYQKEEIEKKEKELSLLLDREIRGFEAFVMQPGDEKYYTREWTLIKKDGTSFSSHLTLSAIKDNDQIIGYLGVAADISEIKEAENELKSLLNVAEGQNKRLRNFAHIVSHNLKSHSGNFEMLLDLFIQENPGIEEDEIVQLFKTASKHLTETIIHLNEVVLINTSVNENLIELNLYEAINNVVESISAIAFETNVTINNLVEHNISVLGVPAYLDSILLNFITNAIKYSANERNSYVTLKASKKENFVVLSVEDNGLGIDLKKHRAKLFGMYKTFHDNEDARGIGLFITKNQVEAMGGRIEVESKVNEGTNFEIYLKYEKN